MSLRTLALAVLENGVMLTEPMSTPISPKRSGVLDPGNLDRYSVRWIRPSAEVADVIDTYWAVRWRLSDREVIDQRILDHPAITLSIEQGQVLAPFVVSAVRRRAWRRAISGAGDVFALRLRPAGLAVLTDLDPLVLSDERELTQALDPRAYRLLSGIAEVADAPGRARRADELVRQLLLERGLTDQQRLANATLDLITDEPWIRPVGQLAAALGTGPRTLQRALRAHLGRGPTEVARRVRLQEAVRRLSVGGVELSAVSAELGYTDQAHLTNEFRTSTGVTPGRYVRDLATNSRDR